MQKELLFEETGIQAIKKVEKVPQPETRTEDEKQNDATAGVATKAETEDLEDTKNLQKARSQLRSLIRLPGLLIRLKQKIQPL